MYFCDQNNLFKILKYFLVLKIRKIITFLSFVIFTSFLSVVKAEDNSSVPPISLELNSEKIAYQIPIRDQIGPPILDILRRGLKSAIEANADIVVIDMDTPGGELGVTLEIMQEIIESFDRFEGPIITYVNKEAISAGAYILSLIHI